jgi:hypothetical protein
MGVVNDPVEDGVGESGSQQLIAGTVRRNFDISDHTSI